MHPKQLKDLIIVPTLRHMDMLSEHAVTLLMGTAAQESRLGHYIAQIQGPALGIFQMEPATEDDIWKNYIEYRPDIQRLIDYLAPNDGLHNQLISNLSYATAMARLAYWRQNFDWPEDLMDIPAYGRIWKKFYNTPQGKGTVDEFVENYYRYCLD